MEDYLAGLNRYLIAAGLVVAVELSKEQIEMIGNPEVYEPETDGNS